ncbi:PIG-L deacetylase family protein [Angustibacter aerolatus]
MPIPDSEVERVLVVAAHPDDIDFGASGTVATWVDAGVEVTYLLCTSGDQGGFDDTPREEMPALRQAEQRAAAKAVGVTDVRFLEGYRDGWLEPSWELQRDIVRVIRQVRPQRVLLPSPERDWNRIQASHPDHLAAGEAAIRAVYPAARNPFAWPELVSDEGLEPWTVREVWLMAHHDSPHFVDVTDAFDRKLEALRSHVSQVSHLGDELDTMLRHWGGSLATAAGFGDGRLAEAFKVVPTG